jgi:diguanylate cyclase (GGDEF)-like protein
VQDIMLTRWSEALHGDWLGETPAERTCCLVCIYPAERLGRVFELCDRELLIGRDVGCDLELSDDSVSRRHALIRPTASGFSVIDLESTNGTYVNDARVNVHHIEPGDRLRFGNQIFKYLSADRFEAEYFENAYRMMTTDGLTQLYNKRYLFDVVERELQRTRRTERPLSLLMVDIDRFKAINDTFGHLAGDEVLIELGRRIRSTLRGHEMVARFGGEEFCLVLPETTLSQALQAAERLRVAVAVSGFAIDRAEVPVTVSVGAACAHAIDEMSVVGLLERADKQLYAAKRAGRNQVAG